MPSEIHMSDVGTIFRVTIKDGTAIVDVSNVDSKLILFQKPSGEVLTKTATLYTNGTDGIIQYVAIDGDLSEIGTWQIQAKIDFGSDVFYTDIQKFKVIRNLS